MIMYSCEKCNKTFTTKASKTNHEKACGNIKHKKELYLCKKCGYKIKASIQKHVNSCDGRGPRSIRRKTHPGKRGGWQKGKSYEDIYGANRALEIKQKLSDSLNNCNRLPWTKDAISAFSKQVSERMKAQYASGWDAVCGRSKKYDYESIVAGKIKVDGTWELKVAIYLDSIGVEWSRPTNRFDYIKQCGKKSTYKPDFYVKDWNSYIEVKGYKTELDLCKWSQFTEKLIIWERDDLIKLGILLK